VDLKVQIIEALRAGKSCSQGNRYRADQQSIHSNSPSFDLREDHFRRASLRVSRGPEANPRDRPICGAYDSMRSGLCLCIGV
jgi:hypothetical protein